MRRRKVDVAGSRTRLVAWALYAAAAAAGAPTCARALEGELLGRRFEIGGHFETRQVFRVDQATEHELNQQVLWTRARYTIADGLSVDVALSLQNGGPATRASRGGVYDIDDVFQSLSPAFEVQEAALLWERESFDVRIGQLKYSWGKLDRAQPNDLINPERFADPFLLEEEERKIGVPSIEASYYLPERKWLPEQGRLTAVWVPRFVPYRLPNARERWFPPAAIPPASFPVFLPPVEGDAEAILVPVSLETRNADPPDFRLENSTYALRFSGFSHGLDYGAYYYWGFQTSPALRLTAQAERDSSSPAGFAGRTFLSPVFRRIHVWGADLAYAWEHLSLRAEAAYTRGRVFNRDLRFLIEDPRQLAPQILEALERLNAGEESVPIDIGPSFVVRDALQWGVGIDWEMEGYELLLQIDQTDVLNNDVTLLADDHETTALANLRKTFWHGDIALQLVALYGITSDYTLLLPRATYRACDWAEIQLGYLHIAGREGSIVGQYKHNDEGFARLRLQF